jgi:hypothetical protein
LRTFEQAPNVVTAAWARRMRWDETGSLAPYRSWPRVEGPIEPTFDVIPLSGSGVLYPPRLLPAETRNVSVFRALCRGNDDVWLKAMTLLAGRPSQVARLRRPLTSVGGTQESALWLTNRHRNDEYIKAVWQHYALPLTRSADAAANRTTAGAVTNANDALPYRIDSHALD